MKDDIEDDGTNELTMKQFSGILANQLLYQGYNLNTNNANLVNDDYLTEPLNPNGKSGDNYTVDLGGNTFGGSNASNWKSSGSIPSFIGGKTDANSQ